MLRGLRENGPVVLVPAAWTVVTAAHLDLVGTHPLFVAHVVMDVVLVAFAALSWDDMRTGTLRVWRNVLLVGLGLTLSGTAGFLVDGGATPLFVVAVVGWMVVPAVGLWYTGRAVPADEAPRAYTAGAALSAAGALVYTAAPVLPGGVAPTAAGLALVGVGQTLGIATAVVQY